MSKKGANIEGIVTKKSEDFAVWYKECLTRSAMIDYYDISGCYILRPWGFSIWENIQKFFDGKIKEIGVKNCYFPLFVTQDKLEKEEENFEGFKAEVAWVTHSGERPLENKIALRPTSETVMYPYFSKWIRSHRDLPLKLNQWCNIVRWEFNNPCPFIRSREFLWQEGHTAHETKKEADEEVLHIINLYKEVYEELLAVPVIRGMKTEKEKFPGGDFTTTIEAFCPQNGKSIQSATSHSLGQNFSKIFGITYESESDSKELKHVWQNSWGLSTRSIGVVVLIHGDDKGLVLPPRVSPIQVVIIPIFMKKVDSNLLTQAAEKIRDSLKKEGIRVELDLRTEKTPGRKYNYWELKGVPIRIEIGPRDLKSNTVVIARRDTGEKIKGIAMNNVVKKCKDLLDDIHTYLFTKAKKEYDSHIKKITDWKDFIPNLEEKNVLLCPFCLEKECEADIKYLSTQREKEEELKKDEVMSAVGAAKSLCIPFIQDKLPKGMKCINPNCNKDAKRWTMFGRSY